MAPFEPKTDSKEFELATPGHAAPQSGTAPTGAADLTIRLWRHDPTANSTPLTWATENVLVYMIADLVAASRGRTASESPTVMAAHFENANQALVAARRIQLSLLEFVACKPGDCLGAAVLIHPPMSAGFSPSLSQNALRLAEPGQIILTEAVSRCFKDLPGIELRPVAALTTGGTEHAGLSELIWASPEQIAKLRDSARVRPTGVSASPVGATMIVNSPFSTRQTDGNSEKTGRDTEAPSDPSGQDGFSRTRESAFEEGLAEFQERNTFITRTRLIVAVAAVLVVGVGVALFYPSGKSKVPQKPLQTHVEEVSPTPTPDPVQPTPAPVQTNPGGEAKTQPPVVKPPAPKPVRKTPKEEKAETPKVPEVAIDEGPGVSTFEGFTQKNIPALLQKARSDAGNGRYDDATHEYQIVLHLQPNNPDAKEGLRKLQLAQQRDQ